MANKLWITLKVIWIIATSYIFSVVFIFSFMFFDAPGSENYILNWIIWGLFVGFFLLLPLLGIYSLFFRKKNDIKKEIQHIKKTKLIKEKELNTILFLKYLGEFILKPIKAVEKFKYYKISTEKIIFILFLSLIFQLLTIIFYDFYHLGTFDIKNLDIIELGANFIFNVISISILSFLIFKTKNKYTEIGTFRKILSGGFIIFILLSSIGRFITVFLENIFNDDIIILLILSILLWCLYEYLLYKFLNISIQKVLVISIISFVLTKIIEILILLPFYF